MHLLQLESWVIRVADQLAQGQVPEDARLELKASWPDDHAKAARRIAGHANAAFGEPILWIIGLDEVRAVIGVSSVETATWLEGVFSFFDGVRPSVQDLVVTVGDATVVALLFDTVRAPFVVKNPHFGRDSTPISHEVPWREATRIRSARREDLIRLLGDTVALPDLECMWAEAVLVPSNEGTKVQIFVTVDLYVVPKPGAAVVVPFHRSEMMLNPHEVRLPVDNGYPRARFIAVGTRRREPVSHTVHGGDSEVVFEGPGSATFTAQGILNEWPGWGEKVDLQVALSAVGAIRPLVLTVSLRVATTNRGTARRWEYRV